MRTAGFPVALAVLLTTLAVMEVNASGEYCHGWRDPQGAWRDGFQCPERYDAAEAIICCGKCELRYCCSSTEARLDQGTCDNDKKGREETGAGHEEGNNSGAGKLVKHVPTQVYFSCVKAHNKLLYTNYDNTRTMFLPPLSTKQGQFGQFDFYFGYKWSEWSHLISLQTSLTACH